MRAGILEWAAKLSTPGRPQSLAYLFPTQPPSTEALTLLFSLKWMQAHLHTSNNSTIILDPGARIPSSLPGSPNP